MSHFRNYSGPLKTFTVCLCMLVSSSHAADIFQYHDDFHSLLEKGKKLYKIPNKIDAITPTLNLEVEIFAAADTRSSAELLYTSTSMLLQQHATLVDVYTKTEYFKDSHIRPSIEILLYNAERVRLKCSRYLSVVKRPELFQQILDLDEIAKDIESNLGKYRPSIKPVQTKTPSIPTSSPNRQSGNSSERK